MTTSATLDQFEAWELEAFAEGANMPQVQYFVQQHPDLWADWQRQYQKQEQVFRSLQRFDCPSPAQLQKYYWQETTASEDKQIASHLQQCASCAEDLQSLTNFLDADLQEADAPAPEKTSVQSKVRSLFPSFNLNERLQEFSERVRTVVADFVPPLLPEFAPMALRSDDPIPTLSTARPATLLFTAEENDISLVAMKEVDGQIFLSGQVLANEPITRGNVTLTPANLDLPAIEAALDSSGSFLINNLQPGYYFIKVSVAEQAIVIPNVFLQ